MLGRPKGRKSSKVKLSGQEEVIHTLLHRKVSKSEIARIFGVHRMTVDSFIKKQGIAINGNPQTNQIAPCAH